MQAFLTWWLKQLASLLPQGALGRSAAPPDASLLEIDHDAARLRVRIGGSTKNLAEASADEAGLQELGLVVRAASNLPRQLFVRLPAERVLRKCVSLPIAARTDLEQALSFEIDHETPFSHDEVHWTYSLLRQDGAHGQLTVDLVVVPRFFMDPLIEAARRAGLEPAGIEVDLDGNDRSFIPLAAPQRRPWLHRRPALLPLAGAAAAFAVVAIATPFLVQQWALASADATISSLEATAKDAAVLRQSADQYARTIGFLNQERSRNGSAVTALAAVTHALPDDTYLNSFSLRDGKLTLSGASPSAANLISLFARSSEFREPAFEAPVVQNPESDLESFTLSVALKQGATP